MLQLSSQPEADNIRTDQLWPVAEPDRLVVDIGFKLDPLLTI